MTDFALLPEDGRPPRLLRFTTLTGGLVCKLDHAKNLLLIDREYYHAMSPEDQWRVDTTHRDLYVRSYGGRVSIAHS